MTDLEDINKKIAAIKARQQIVAPGKGFWIHPNGPAGVLSYNNEGQQSLRGLSKEGLSSIANTLNKLANYDKDRQYKLLRIT